MEFTPSTHCLLYIVKTSLVDSIFFFIECGSVINNTLTSPGYPNNYPRKMECHYTVPIPDGMAIKIDFNYFDVGPNSGSSCQ